MHPDKLEVCIKVKLFESKKTYLEVTRRYGGLLLFHLIYNMLKAFILDGEAPKIYRGQLCPCVNMTPKT